MNTITFSPKQPLQHSEDVVAQTLSSVARYLFIISIVLLPIFFLPTATAPLAHTKIMLIASGLLGSLVFYSLFILRTGKLRTQITPPLLAIWVVVIVFGVSALLSGSPHQSFIDFNFATQSVLFVGLLALMMTIGQFVISTKNAIVQIYLGLFIVGITLALFHISRLIFGADFLSFGIATNPTFTVLGTWNDLGIFYGLLLILSLITLEQLPLPKIGKYVFAFISILSIIILATVQFSLVWVLVGFSSLIVLMYALMRHRIDPDFKEASSLSVILSTVIAIAAVIFVIAGSNTNTFINNLTGINYLEVRPSFTATADIARNIYSENILIGNGPNRFADAWRLYKDPSINNTIFWNTDFVAGSGYLPTLFATTGMLGTISILAFLGLFIRLGYQMLIKTKRNDPFWYFVGTSSFVAAMYLWVMAFLYVPSATILILTAIFTTIALVACSALCNTTVLVLDTIQNTRYTIILVICVLVIIVSSVSGLYTLSNHYTAHVNFNQASVALSNNDRDGSYQTLDRITFQTNTDVYPRALATAALGQINQLLTIPEPSEQQQEQFLQEFSIGVEAGQIAVNRNRNRSSNWATLAAVYSTFVSAEVPNAAVLAREALQEAMARDPLNPELYLLEARIAIGENDIPAAREAIDRSLSLKPNYVTALGFLAELDITSGNIAQARESVISILQIQPNNPGRYYQLAILLLAEDDQTAAIQVLEEAIRLDTNFANARYVLALQYADTDRYDEAIAQLVIVQELNPDNTEVAELIAQLRAGEDINISSAQPPAVDLLDGSPVTSPDGTIQADQLPDSNLFNPVNVPAGESANQTEFSEEILTSPNNTNQTNVNQADTE